MSQYKLVNVVESGIEDITSELVLPVISATDSNTYQNYNAQTKNKTTIQYSIQVPSLATSFKRNVLTQTSATLKIPFAGGKTAKYWKPDAVLFAYGQTNSLQAFPINSSYATVQTQVNNATVTFAGQNILPALLKLQNYEELAKTNSLCPSLVDSFYQSYQDGLGSNSNVLANYASSTFAKEYQARGCFPVEIYDDTGKLLTNYIIKADAEGTSPYEYITLKFTSTEPILFLSPFSTGVAQNQANMIGINGLNFTFTMLANAGDYMMSNASYAQLDDGTLVKTIQSVNLVEFTDCKALFNYQTIPPQLYEKILPKNVLNFNQYVPYPTTYNDSTGIAPNGGTKVLQSNNFQLSQVPSKLIIFAVPSNKTSYDSNSFLVIEEIVMNFAGRAGLLSGITQQQLYNLSIQNGLQENFYEFSGSGVSSTINADGSVSVKQVPTIGSILVIDPAQDLSLGSQYSNMSSGQFNLSFTIKIKNQTKETINAYTLYVVEVDNGLFITENGKSEYNTGFLSQEQVLETKAGEAIIDTHTYNNEVVGGSIENIGSIHKYVKRLFSRNSEKERKLDHEAGETVNPAGSAMSGGAISAGNGARKKLHSYMK